jgi:hypothetical protein
VLTPPPGGTSSQQRFRLLTTNGRTVCRETCKRSDSESADPPAATGTSLPKQAGKCH